MVGSLSEAGRAHDARERPALYSLEESEDPRNMALIFSFSETV